MADTIDPNGRFGALFTALPWPIIENICQYLPAILFSKVLLKNNILKPFIIQKYFSHQVPLYLIDPDGKVTLDKDYERSPCEIIGYSNIISFFRDCPGIAPEHYIIYADLKYTGLEDVLRKCRHALRQAERLEIRFSTAGLETWSERQEPSRKLMNRVFSFCNLHVLHGWCSRGKFTMLPEQDNLQCFFLHTMGKMDWGSISLPRNLTGFKLSVVDAAEKEGESDVEDYRSPLRNIFVKDTRKRPISNHQLRNLLWKPYKARCPHLTDLTLTNCGIHCLDLTILPPTLTSLYVLKNDIEYINSSDSRPCWPPNLSELSLADNEMSDWTVCYLSEIEWPDQLESLFLCNNKITTLDCLFNLPENLYNLSVQDNHCLKSLGLSNDGYGYLFRSFPDSLHVLDMNGCENIEWPHSSPDEATEALQWLYFPHNLVYLGVYGSNIRTEAHFVFPPSICKLDMEKSPEVA